MECVPLEQLLAQADFLSLHCTLNDSTRHILNRERLALMKPTAVVINTARGALIDEQALTEALTTGKIFGVALDVFEVEPLPEQSPLRKLQNVLLSPHNANASPSAWKRVHENTLKNLLEGLGV
jgi:D-3-phosphoglycerate dehydrogenase